MEIWKKVEWASAYMVSDLGNLKRVVPDRLNRPLRMLKGGIDTHGYRNAHLLADDGIYKMVLIYKLVAEAFIGKCPVGNEIHHKDGNKINDVVSNLEYVSQGKHLVRTYDQGRYHRNWMKPDDVTKIRELKKEGYCVTDISMLFEKGTDTISRICNFKSFKRLNLLKVAK